MTVHPHQKNHAWILGRNRTETASFGRFGDRDRTFKFDGYWSGDKWVKGSRFAKTFESEVAAIAYLDVKYVDM